MGAKAPMGETSTTESSSMTPKVWASSLPIKIPGCASASSFWRPAMDPFFSVFSMLITFPAVAGSIPLRTMPCTLFSEVSIAWVKMKGVAATTPFASSTFFRISG